MAQVTLEQLREIAKADNAVAWLRVIREGESNQSEDAFTVLYGGSHFTSFDDHPRQRFSLPGGTYTTAAGAYQITESTWNDYTRFFGARSFDPENQSLCALWLTNRAGALDDVVAGRLDAAIRGCAKVWTSLAIPKRQEEAPSIFAAYGGKAEAPQVEQRIEPTADPKAIEALIPSVNPIATPTPPIPKDAHMGVLAALLPSLIQMIPQLGQLFGSGTEVSNRNIAAAKVVADTVVQATQSTNVQDAIEKMTTDGDALSAARDAVSELLPQLLDVGGGVESARKFAADHENSRYGRILEVVTYCAMFFLAVANAAAFVVYLRGEDLGPMNTVMQADIGSALIAFGYFLGSSISSKRKDEMRASQ